MAATRKSLRKTRLLVTNINRSQYLGLIFTRVMEMPIIVLLNSDVIDVYKNDLDLYINERLLDF